MTTLQELEQELYEVDSILAQRLDNDYSQYKQDPVGFITEVLGETLTDDLRAVCDSVAKHQITIAQSGNATGKSWISAQIAVWFFLTQEQPQIYGCAAAPESNLKNILWAEIDDARERHPELFTDCSARDLFVRRNPREFLTGVTIPTAGTDKMKEARFSGKHAKSLLFVADEADAIPDPVFAGIDTCLSGGMTRLLVIFNPRQRLGAVYRMVKFGQANVVKLTAFSHPNVITGQPIIPGAVDREKTARRVAQWPRPLALGEKKDKRCYELPEYLVGCIPVDQKGDPLPPLIGGTYRITEHQFNHVVLGQYPAQSSNQLISETWIDNARSRYDVWLAEYGETPPEGVKAVAGVDVAEHGIDSSVLAKRYGILLLPLTVWEGKQEIIDVGDLVADALQDSNFGSIQVDGTGVGSGVAPYLSRKNLPAVSVKVASAATEPSELGEFGILRDQLLWSIRDWLRNDLTMLPPDSDLIEELTILTYAVDRGKVRVMKTDDIKDLLKRSPDRLMALAMTFHKTGIFAGLDLS